MRAVRTTKGRALSSKRDMKHTMNLWLVVAALVIAPTVVYGWHDHHGDRHRVQAEIRREWRDAMRESRRAIREARLEVWRAQMERRREARQAFRDATREARDAVREAAREARRQARDAMRWNRW